MAVVAHLENSVCAADVHPTVCRAVSCDGGFVHDGEYLALSVERAGVGPLAVQPGSSSLLLQLLVLYDPCVVAANDPLEVRHAAVAELDCMPI